MARDQLQVLNAPDVAKTQWYYLNATFIAGIGFLTDAYDLLCTSFATKLFSRMYYPVDDCHKFGSLPPGVAATVHGVAFVGIIVGWLFFGWLLDKMGRKRVYKMKLIIKVICLIGSGLSY